MDKGIVEVAKSNRNNASFALNIKTIDTILEDYEKPIPNFDVEGEIFSYLVNNIKINSTENLYNDIVEWVKIAWKPNGEHREKRKSFEWKQASWEANKPRILMDFKRVHNLALVHRLDVEEKKICLVRHKDGKDGFLFLPYTNMLCKSYVKKKMKRIEILPNGLGITLTLRYSKNDSISDSMIKLNESFDKFMTYLNRELSPNKKFDSKTKDIRFKLKYFACREISHGEGVCHIHMLVLNKKFISQSRIKRLWHKITTDSFKVWVSKRNRRAVEYISKYFTKTMKGILTDSIVALWACGQRVFSTSSKLFQEYEEEENEIIVDFDILLARWHFMGIIMDSECELEGFYEFPP